LFLGGDIFMGKRGPKKRFDSKLDFTIESEYVDLIEKIAQQKGITRSAVLRRVIKENLSEFIQEEEEQRDLLEELRNGDF
jgi:hypothetical protein